MQCNGNMEARNLIFDDTTVLHPANMNLLVQNSLILSMCTQIKNCKCIKPNTVIGKTGHKWKNVGT